MTVDAGRRVVAVSEAARVLGGFSGDEMPTALADLVAAADLDRVLGACQEAEERGVSREVVFSFRDGSGRSRVTSAVVEDLRHDLSVAGLVMHLGAEVRRPLRSTLFEGVARYSTEAIVVLDRDWTVVDCSPGVLSVFGEEPDAIIGRTFGPAPVGNEYRAAMAAGATRVAAAPHGHSELFRYRVSTAVGADAWIETRLTNLFEDPLVRGLLATSRVVTEEQEALDELSRRVDRDPITELPNRHGVEKMLADAVRSGVDRPVLMVDVDGFAHVNDSYGHLAGDDVLRRIADRLRGVCGGRPVGRFGSDEFVVLGEPDEDPAALAAVLQEAVGLPMDGVTSSGWQLGLSVGSCTLHRVVGAGQALRRAGVALAEAKGAGRCGYAVWNVALDANRTRRRVAGEEIRRALAAGQFEMRFEPIVDLHTGELVSCESLVRWRHPWRGLLSPKQFLAITADEGLQGELDLWVAEQVVAVAARWERSGYQLGVAMNASAQGLARGLPEKLEGLCGVHDLDPCRLTVELLESIRPRPDLMAQIDRLGALGVGLAIDDFGTGYSCLASIPSLKASVIKIDGSFIEGVEADPGSRAIIEAAVSIARAFGMTVVAEWVQREEQREALAGLGVTQGQGSLFGGAVTAAEFERRYLVDR